MKNARVYIAGPIEAAVQEDWRDYPRKRLTEEFGLQVFDPFIDPKQQWLAVARKAKVDRDFETMTEIAKSFVRKDLAIVDRSDVVIAYLPHGVPTTGTVHEIINANNAKKPTLLVTNMDSVAYIPLWYYGFIKLEFMFAGWDKLFDYLREVDRGGHKHNNRWSYVYGDV